MTIKASGTITIDGITDEQLSILFKFKADNQGFGAIFSNMNTLDDGINNNVILNWQTVDGFLKVATIIKQLT